MLLISSFYLIFILKERWFRVKKALKSRSSTVWLLFLFKYFLSSYLLSFQSFFSIFWLFSLILLFIFWSIHSLSLLRSRIYNALRVSSYWKTLSLLFMTFFSTDFFLLIHKVFLSCLFLYLILSWFVRNFLKTHQVRFNRLSTLRRSRSLYLDDLNE